LFVGYSNFEEVDQKMKNQELRNLIKAAGIRYWQIAEKVGVSQHTLTVWFHTTLTAERKYKVKNAISLILKEREEIVQKIK
jgi:hypothetical protein